jgi:hypothetical protein
VGGTARGAIDAVVKSLASSQPQAGKTVVFKTAQKAPAKFDAWSFVWVFPQGVDKSAELDISVIQPNGQEYFKHEPTPMQNFARHARSDFKKGTPAGDPSMLFNREIKFVFRATKGGLNFPPGKYEFWFFNAETNGQINWRNSFRTIEAAVESK